MPQQLPYDPVTSAPAGTTPQQWALHNERYNNWRRRDEQAKKRNLGTVGGGGRPTREMIEASQNATAINAALKSQYGSFIAALNAGDSRARLLYAVSLSKNAAVAAAKKTPGWDGSTYSWGGQTFIKNGPATPTPATPTSGSPVSTNSYNISTYVPTTPTNNIISPPLQFTGHREGFDGTEVETGAKPSTYDYAPPYKQTQAAQSGAQSTTSANPAVGIDTTAQTQNKNTQFRSQRSGYQGNRRFHPFAGA